MKYCLFMEYVHGEVLPSVEYVLTSRGKSFVPILESMKAWGEQELGLEEDSAVSDRSLAGWR